MRIFICFWAFRFRGFLSFLSRQRRISILKINYRKMKPLIEDCIAIIWFRRTLEGKKGNGGRK